MGTTTAGRGGVKRRNLDGDHAAGDEARELVRDEIEELARHGARQMLTAALNDEVGAYLHRDRYQRQAEFRGYRNGATPRRLTLCSGTVALDMPRRPGGTGTVRVADHPQAPTPQPVARIGNEPSGVYTGSGYN